MMKQNYMWLIWSSAFLVPWIMLYLANSKLRRIMWRVSLAHPAHRLRHRESDLSVRERYTTGSELKFNTY